MAFSSAQRKSLRFEFRERVRRERGFRARILSGLSDRDVDAVLAHKEEQFRNRYPNKGDGEILKMLLEWISAGGLEAILKFITGLLSVL